MNAQALLLDLTAQCVILLTNGDRLDIEAPDDVLTDELLTTLRDHKVELLALLRSEPGAGELCPICGSTCEEQRGDRFRHVWCPTPGHYDSWRASPDHKLGESPLFDEWRGMEKKI